MARRFASHNAWRERVLGRIDRVNRENERREQLAREKANSRMEQKPPVTDHEMAEAMITFGGSFVAALGQAWHRADEENRAKLLATWPHYAAEYREIAGLKRERARQG